VWQDLHMHAAGICRCKGTKSEKDPVKSLGRSSKRSSGIPSFTPRVKDNRTSKFIFSCVSARLNAAWTEAREHDWVTPTVQSSRTNAVRRMPYIYMMLTARLQDLNATRITFALNSQHLSVQNIKLERHVDRRIHHPPRNTCKIGPRSLDRSQGLSN